MNDAYAVILVGGRGKRLRPLSTGARPKAFLSVTSDRKTMFRKTLIRAARLVRKDNIIIVANSSHGRLVRRDFPSVRKENLLYEPVSRNTAPAIAYACAALRLRGIDGVIAVLPTDQYIINEEKYLASLEKAIKFAKKEDAIVVIGVRPDSASTGFGYIRIHRGRTRSKGVFKVERFTEKPNINTAKDYIRSGEFLWNTGVFVFKASVMWKAFRYFAPRISGFFEKRGTAFSRYHRLPDISIDYAVMEKAANVYCVKGDYGWRDVGNFENLRWALIRESRDFLSRGDKVLKIL